MTLISRWLALAALGAAGGAAWCVPAAAQGVAPPAAVTADDSLYQQLGAQPGLVRLMDHFVAGLIADPRMNPFFKDVDQAHLKKQLIDQFCEVAGGPCQLKGPDMKKSHAALDITKRDFNALVEVLQDSLSAQGIPFTTQNRLLAKLAPMHRDIINTP